MALDKRDVLVYAHWKGMPEPKQIGVLLARFGKGRKSFSFEYHKDWLRSQEQFLLDPDVGWYSGVQFPGNKVNFGVFLDSMPDTWGRTLMKRRNSLRVNELGVNAKALYDIDFLLGVYDESRMGALRFKLSEDGPFLDANTEFPTPPWSSVRELQYCAELVESDKEIEEIRKWLAILVAPGSSLGGARPKANILDDNGHPWIAKFPSKNDDIDKALWEYLAYELALNAGIEMAESKIEKVFGKHNTFFTKRFDREGGERLHFASAMTMTGNNEDTIKEKEVGYLDIAEFVQFSGANVEKDLHQLWRRIAFNIAVSNTDDHLRNHGFILTPKGWILSPAFDINPSIEKDGLALNIDMYSNALNFELAKSVGEYFMLNQKDITIILEEVKVSVSQWEKVAKAIGISRNERQIMQSAFRY
ncbi:MAG: HipA domain-containing protein [Salinivirgaceae bacterium]|jgi:serine/threonine-protein kinase HipA|nr:HipA domain-containing protein [Salinivirgaceae bacterium]